MAPQRTGLDCDQIVPLNKWKNLEGHTVFAPEAAEWFKPYSKYAAFPYPAKHRLLIQLKQIPNSRRIIEATREFSEAVRIDIGLKQTEFSRKAAKPQSNRKVFSFTSLRGFAALREDSFLE